MKNWKATWIAVLALSTLFLGVKAAKAAAALWSGDRREAYLFALAVITGCALVDLWGRFGKRKVRP